MTPPPSRNFYKVKLMTALDMEDLRKTEEYKKAYERADRLCKYMPELIRDMVSPKEESPTHKLAFEDRIQLFKKEKGIYQNLKVGLSRNSGSRIRTEKLKMDYDKFKDREL
jgi:hypothetical protein